MRSFQEHLGTPFKTVHHHENKVQDFDDEIAGAMGGEDDEDEQQLSSVFRMYQMGGGLW